MKKSKHSPLKLPPNQVGLYSTLDPHQYIETNLSDWYLNLSYIPSPFLWDDIFTQMECHKFQIKIDEIWPDFEEQACLGFRYLYPYFEDDQKNQHKFNTFNNKDYLKQISSSVASYKSLMSIKPLMKEILSDRHSLFEWNGDLYITPGQPKKELLRVLIQDIESLSNEYFPDSRKYKPYRSVLAFYLAKLDIFEGLKCINKRNREEPCSTIECIKFEKENCMEEVKDRSKKYKFKIDSKVMMFCQKNLIYSNCKKCRSHVRYLSDLSDFSNEDTDIPDFLRTPCQVAIGHYNDILERIKEDKNSGNPRAIDIRKIKEFREELQTARLNNSKKDITAIYNKAKERYPHLTRKKIQRFLS